jgi:RNA polymerase sigma-70 factor, ECF subfamily
LRGVNRILEVDGQNLIKLCKQNKREGYDLLFLKYQKYIYKICYNYTYSKEDALDLTQEVFLKIYKSIKDFDDDKTPLPWIKKISVNTCINFNRNNRSQPVIQRFEGNTADDDRTEEDTLESQDNTEDQVLELDTRRIIEKSITELPSKEKMALTLKHMNDMSYSEISEVMSVPLGTVKTYIYRARKILKDVLKDKEIWD